MIALYIPGNSPVHRLRAATKLLSLAAIGTLVFFVQSIALLTIIVGLVIALYRLAGLYWAAIWDAVRPLLWLPATLFVVHAVINSWENGLQVALRFIALVSLAVLLTLTTRASDMVAVLVRWLGPLRHIGLPSERLGLMLSMTLRYIPTILAEYQSLADAHRARGGNARTLSLLLPLLVRSLRQADALAEAIDARAYDP